jgi:hypothetical protein
MCARVLASPSLPPFLPPRLFIIPREKGRVRCAVVVAMPLLVHAEERRKRGREIEGERETSTTSSAWWWWGGVFAEVCFLAAACFFSSFPSVMLPQLSIILFLCSFVRLFALYRVSFSVCVCVCVRVCVCCATFADDDDSPTNEPADTLRKPRRCLFFFLRVHLRVLQWCCQLSHKAAGVALSIC